MLPNPGERLAFEAEICANLNTVSGRKQDEPKQKTPKGWEIRVPRRSELFDAFRKTVQPTKAKNKLN